jgi:hypothetical protein
VGGMTFEFKGATCNSGGSRTIHGWFGGVSGVWCKDLGPVLYEPERDCKSDNCSEDEQLAPHSKYTFKVGRASLAGLPLVGSELADRYGCEVVAAYVNVGSEGAGPIYREFLYVGRRQGCPFDVEKGTVSKDFFPAEMQLSFSDPENPLDFSDFHGQTKLSADGELAVEPPDIGNNYSIKLPGRFDDKCTGGKGSDKGLLVPLDDVRCGVVPEPTHDTTPDPDPHADCRDYTKMSPAVADGIERFKDGEWDDILMASIHLKRVAIFYEKPLKSLFWTIPGTRFTPAVFVGWNHQGIPIITFVDMEIVSYSETAKGEPLVTVRFLSEACSYDVDGNPVFVQPFHCKEGLPTKGLMKRLESPPLMPVTPPTPPDKPGVPPPPDPSSGTGSGSRTAAVPPPEEPVLV